ncbi:MAG: DUF2079 domain-containing protein [Chloroflexi bacterium]|nr:DUF2079 domain-containing protein [Chloroflexota bacterium]MCI0725296.1 DUF2079 domain-containing protein [Chloroflexota bacterium]
MSITHRRLTPRAVSRSTLLVALLIAAAFAEMAWLSVAQYQGYNLRSFDLGNMSQAIWSAMQGEPLVFTTEGFAWSRLSFHVELFYFLLIPLYALWPSPVTLLIFQAALYATGAWPLYHLAGRRLQSNKAALVLVAIYLLYPVAQTAVLFNFHGDTLAMPLLLWAIEALDRRAWHAYAFWLSLALSCKFYVAAAVVALGVALWLQGQRRVGTATTLAALVWGAFAFLIIRSLFAPPEEIHSASSAGGYVSYYFDQLNVLWRTAPLRLVHGLIVVGPVILLVWRAPLWLLPAGAIIGPTLLSSGPGPSYDYRYHHYALAVPFLLAGSVYALEAMRASSPAGPGLPPWRRRLRLSLLLAVIFNVALVNTPASPLFYVAVGTNRGLDASVYGRTPRDAFKDGWLARTVPEAAPLMADDQLGIRLINREVYYRTRPQFGSLPNLLPRVEYVVVDALYDFALGTEDRVYEGGVRTNHRLIGSLLDDPAFSLLVAQDGLLLFGRSSPPLTQQVELAPGADFPGFLATFGDAIGLVDAQIIPGDSSHFHLRCRWMALRSLAAEPPLLAVSRPEGLAHARIVHLPTLALLPTTEWPEGQIVEETFEFTLPEDTPAGSYPLLVGWYDSSSLFAAETDERSRVGNEIQIGRLEVP